MRLLLPSFALLVATACGTGLRGLADTGPHTEDPDPSDADTGVLWDTDADADTDTDADADTDTDTDVDTDTDTDVDTDTDGDLDYWVAGSGRVYEDWPVMSFGYETDVWFAAGTTDVVCAFEYLADGFESTWSDYGLCPQCDYLFEMELTDGMTVQGDCSGLGYVEGSDFGGMPTWGFAETYDHGGTVFSDVTTYVAYDGGSPSTYLRPDSATRTPTPGELHDAEWTYTWFFGTYSYY